MYTYDFPMAATSTTMVLYRDREILLGLRGADVDAFPNIWALPGGFMNVGTERILEAASRETKEETGLDIDPSRWQLFFVDDKIGIDPRYVQIVNLCYSASVTSEEYHSVMALDDLQEVKWVDFQIVRQMNLPFNNNEVIDEFMLLSSKG